MIMNKKGLKFQIRQLIKQAVQNVVLPVCYNFHRFRKTDPKLVVFADAHHDSRPAAMELLYRRLRKDGSWKITEHYLDYGSAGAAAVAKHSIRFMRLYAEAGFVVICDNFLPVASCRKRRETKVIQLWHACGCYKKFGYDAKDDIPDNYHGANVYRNADLITVSGEAAVKPFASAMRLPEDCVRALGVSRTDLYFSRVWRERCREQFYEKYPDASGKKVILWAPTFRGNAGMPETVSLDISRLSEQLGGDYYVLARLHPHMLSAGSGNKELNDSCSGTGCEFLCSIPTEELYPVTDVLIADYSSLIYEYLLFNGELILYVPDLETYRAERGFYMDIQEIPGRIVTEESHLADAVRLAADDSRTAGSAPDEREAGRSAIRKDFLNIYMGSCDGRATERIAEWMKER